MEEEGANKVLSYFRKVFGEGGAIRVFFAPGRVNLIGDHTDYNGGYVFPIAVELGTYAAMRRRKDRRILLYSANCDDLVEAELGSVSPDAVVRWANYPKGVVKVLLDEGLAIGGFEVVFYGDLPMEAGLSSSASIEVVTALGLSELFDLGLSGSLIAQLCRKAENEFVGVNCGIMDQFASALSKENCALLLKSDTLEFEHIPLPLSGYAVVVTNTNKKRSLADSEYNQRRFECERALSDLRRVLRVKNLADVTPGEFAIYGRLISDEVIRKRARHVVTENHRVLQAVQALRNGNLVRFGELMVQSHSSLKYDFEVSCPELDLLVELALTTEGVLGTRMTGAGFGGCTVSIVKTEALEYFKDRVSAEYTKAVGYSPSIYVVRPAQGARALRV
ncbi:galactokinase [Coprothermobacteraceae bacterium]|nr:galactokinase [Coprothermobacteraceae bacterium]